MSKSPLSILIRTFVYDSKEQALRERQARNRDKNILTLPGPSPRSTTAQESWKTKGGRLKVANIRTPLVT